MFYKQVPYSQQYLAVGLVGLVKLGLPLSCLLLPLGLLELALWLVTGLALNKYRCE